MAATTAADPQRGASRLFTGLLGAGQVVLRALDPGPRPGDRLNHRGLGGMPGRAERVAARLPSHLLVPRIFGRMVKVPALVTVVAVLLGGALLGIVGALVAIPAAAALLLLAREVLFSRLRPHLTAQLRWWRTRPGRLN